MEWRGKTEQRHRAAPSTSMGLCLASGMDVVKALSFPLSQCCPRPLAVPARTPE